MGQFASPVRVEFGTPVFWKRCEGLGLGFWAFGKARELRARNIGEGDAVEERRCWGESHVQVLESEGEWGG